MLLISVFMRPACLIIGFLTATVLLRVAVGLLNLGFSVAGSALQPDDAGMGSLFIKWGALIVYTMIIIRLINFAYSLIHHVPDKIMKWIGLSAGGYGSGEREMQEIEGGAASGMQAAAQPLLDTGNAIRSEAGSTETDTKERDKEWNDYCKENGIDPDSDDNKFGEVNDSSAYLDSSLGREDNEHSKKYKELTKKHTHRWGGAAKAFTKTRNQRPDWFGGDDSQ